MDRRQRSIMSGVHCLQHVEGFAPAHLADDDAFRSHSQAVSNQVPRCDLALAFDVWWSRLQSHNMWLLQLQFGRVLDRDNPLVVRNEAREYVQLRRLSRARTAGDNDILARLDNGLKNQGNLGRNGVKLDHIVNR